MPLPILGAVALAGKNLVEVGVGGKDLNKVGQELLTAGAIGLSLASVTSGLPDGLNTLRAGNADGARAMGIGTDPA